MQVVVEVRVILGTSACGASAYGGWTDFSSAPSSPGSAPYDVYTFGTATKGPSGAGFTLCWQSGSGGAFPVAVGTFTMHGPESADGGVQGASIPTSLAPVAGQTFSLRLLGDGFSVDDRVRIVASTVSCGDTASNDAQVRGDFSVQPTLASALSLDEQVTGLSGKREQGP